MPSTIFLRIPSASFLTFSFVPQPQTKIPGKISVVTSRLFSFFALTFLVIVPSPWYLVLLLSIRCWSSSCSVKERQVLRRVVCRDLASTGSSIQLDHCLCRLQCPSRLKSLISRPLFFSCSIGRHSSRVHPRLKPSGYRGVAESVQVSRQTSSVDS